MKSGIINSIGVLLFVGSLLMGCEKDYQVYDADLEAIRFSTPTDSMVYSFALMPGVETDTVEIPLQILGFTAAADRVAEVVVVSEKTTATVERHYQLLPCVIPAGEIEGTQKVVVHRTDDLESGEGCVALRIGESADFIPGPVNERFFRLIITDHLTLPDGWRREFGDYSIVKHRFIIEITGKGTNYNEWKRAELLYNMGLLWDALYEYNNAHPGQPLRDENGIPITFPEA